MKLAIAALVTFVSLSITTDAAVYLKEQFVDGGTVHTHVGRRGAALDFHFEFANKPAMMVDSELRLYICQS